MNLEAVGASFAAWRTLNVFLVLALLCWTSKTGADDVTRLTIQFHVVERQGQPVADTAFLAAQLAHARRVFEAVSIDFIAASSKSVPARHAEVVSRADRDAFARYLAPSVINCMVVASLRDVDEPGRVRRGVHWRPRRAPDRHYVIVSAISGPNVLAHELGHFFGNRSHSETPGNIMSYQLTEALPFFDAAQADRVRATLRKQLASSELAPAGE